MTTAPDLLQPPSEPRHRSESFPKSVLKSDLDDLFLFYSAQVEERSTGIGHGDRTHRSKVAIGKSATAMDDDAVRTPVTPSVDVDLIAHTAFQRK